VLAIRKRAHVRFTLDDYVRDGIATTKQVTLLRDAVANRRNIVVAGGTGSAGAAFFLECACLHLSGRRSVCRRRGTRE
jgi:type IV secretion system protein VirB11